MPSPSEVARAAADLVDPPEWNAQNRPPLEPHQQPPDGEGGVDWDGWLLEAGRGAGKTEACSRYFAKYMREHPGTRGRIIAPTQGDAIESCVTGLSGLLAVDPGVKWIPSSPGGAKVRWPNGSEALVLGTHTKKDVERLRAAGNRTLDWFEELAAFNWLQESRDQADFGRRVGKPHWIASTTPRPTRAYKRARAEVDHLVTGVTMFDNPHNPDSWVTMMRKKYEGTRLGRQELLGELIDDVEGALWKRSVLDTCRVDSSDVPDLAVVVVAIDPAATSGPNADDTGMIVAGLGTDGEGYVMADRTCHLAPDGWAARAIRAYSQFDADRIIGEANNGGEMVEAVILAQDKNVPVKLVYASRNKQTRAEPVATLFGAPPKRPPRVHLVGGFPELEDELCTWVPGEDDSPDRLDAMVWAITDLMLDAEEPSSWRPA